MQLGLYPTFENLDIHVKHIWMKWWKLSQHKLQLVQWSHEDGSKSDSVPVTPMVKCPNS